VDFISRHDASKNFLAEGYWFLFYRDLLVTAPPKNDAGESESAEVPRRKGTVRNAALEDLQSRVGRSLYIGRLNGTDCYAGNLSSETDLPPGYTLTGLRPLYGKLRQDSMRAARFALHLLHWDKTTRFCGVCGAATQDKADERAKVCGTCGTVFYPRIAPAVILAILDGKKILLAHNRRFAAPIYSLIAGFIEIGETAEECIVREVQEEVGVRIKNIRYFGSQPWPFPDSLMLGFTAEYAGGEIRVDNNELLDAKWFSPPGLPTLPPSDSIARKIITWYEQEYIPSLGN
jgi:NAD+ diphosphatase